MDVKSLDNNSSGNPYRRSLLLFLLGGLLMAQACSASDLKMDMIVSPQILYLGNSPTVSVHVYDINQPQFTFSGIPIFTKVMYVDNQTEVPSNGGLTNASGWYTFSFTPQVTGTYRIFADTTVNYSTVPGLPSIGNQHALKFQYHNVTSRFVLPFTPIKPVVLVTVTTTPVPVATTQTAQQSTPVTPVTQATLMTQVTQVTQTTPAVPAITAATIQPVTSLPPVQPSAAGTTGPEETLTTTTAPPAATPADIPSYPVPLWLVALIIFVILVAIGGGLYLKSRQDKEEPKK
jgi:hypothetical protein